MFDLGPLEARAHTLPADTPHVPPRVFLPPPRYTHHHREVTRNDFLTLPGPTGLEFVGNLSTPRFSFVFLGESPSQENFVNPDTGTVQLNFSKAGSFTMELTATDPDTRRKLAVRQDTFTVRPQAQERIITIL